MSATAAIRSIFAPASASLAEEQAKRENLAVADGLKRQKAGLLDELIVRYQHRLLRSAVSAFSDRKSGDGRGPVSGSLDARFDTRRPIQRKGAV
jgi:hypothetical protein